MASPGSVFKLPKLQAETDDPELAKAVTLPPTAAGHVAFLETHIIRYMKGLGATVGKVQENLARVQKLSELAQKRRAQTSVLAPVQIGHASALRSATTFKRQGSPLLQSNGVKGSDLVPEEVQPVKKRDGTRMAENDQLPPSTVPLDGVGPESGRNSAGTVLFGQPRVSVKDVKVKAARGVNGKEGEAAASSPQPPVEDELKQEEEEVKTLIKMQLPKDAYLVPELLELKRLSIEMAEALENINLWLTLRSAPFRQGSQTRALLEVIAEKVGTLLEKAADREDGAMEYLRARSDMEKALFKHPTSKVLLERIILCIPEAYDVLEDGYRAMCHDLLNLQLYMGKDLPVVDEVVAMEGYGGGPIDDTLEAAAQSMFS